MLPFIVGGVALVATGYGLAKVLEDDCPSVCSEEKKYIKEDLVEKFYLLNQTVFDTSYQEFQSIIEKIKNLELDTKEVIVLKKNFPENEEHQEKIDNVAEKLYTLLYKSDKIFKEHLLEVSNIVKISNDYDSYSKSAKEIVSNTLVLAGIINDILNVKLVNENDKPTKNSKKLILEVKRVLKNFEDEFLIQGFTVSHF